jgi:hypothetical protein
MRDEDFDDFIDVLLKNINTSLEVDLYRDSVKVDGVVLLKLDPVDSNDDSDSDEDETGLRSDQLLQLFESLQINTSIKMFSLIIDCDNFSIRTFNSLCNMLAKTQTLRGFHLEVGQSNRLIKFNRETAKIFSDALLANGSLQKLDLVSICIVNESFTFFLNAIEQHSTLSSLMLTKVLGDHEAIKLLASLENKNQIEKLVLNENALTDAIAPALSKLLICETTALRSLSLRQNQLADVTAQHLFRALVLNKSLRTLNVANNSFTDNGAEYFVEILKNNDTLRNFYLFGMQFSSPKKNDFLSALVLNTSLQAIYFDDDRQNTFYQLAAKLCRFNTDILGVLATYPLPSAWQKIAITELLNLKLKLYQKYFSSYEVNALGFHSIFGAGRVKNEVTTGMASLKQLTAAKVFDFNYAGLLNQRSLNKKPLVADLVNQLTAATNPAKIMKKKIYGEKVDLVAMSEQLRLYSTGPKKQKRGFFEEDITVLTWGLKPN